MVNKTHPLTRTIQGIKYSDREAQSAMEVQKERLTRSSLAR